MLGYSLAAERLGGGGSRSLLSEAGEQRRQWISTGTHLAGPNYVLESEVFIPRFAGFPPSALLAGEDLSSQRSVRGPQRDRTAAKIQWLQNLRGAGGCTESPDALCSPESPDQLLRAQSPISLEGGPAHTADGHLSPSGYFYFSFPVLTTLAPSRQRPEVTANKKTLSLALPSPVGWS